ncbi:Acyl transferase domain-containing protein [Litoreibacter ascidiaceicola]|uniref:Acyl transferase domain-containing protein n=1 Tax=Litoreibacter ascidiaceicola TaxID=1486859 RepID=A0A1M5DUW9_9RHOB|nr:type I polyketide synthase [Litoreibacter ascidiaceicola]SHF70797.1 Acyl transferase domain-containing protein [Litoreibacter ascidiaceicola]
MSFDPENLISESDIAIVGMAGHFPGAHTIDEYWQNLRNGIESIRHYTAEELLAAGEAQHLINRDDYVPAAAPLDGFAHFDAEFFGLSPKEAAIMDPQHRRFLEVSWEALENAGHMPENAKGPIGVYAGCGMGSYFYFNICSNPDLVNDVGMFLLRHTGNDKDFLSTRLSHVLNLKGPSVTMQTACSTSLVTTHYAAQALMTGECDTALAGGVTIELPQDRGYIFKEGEVLSPDGHCHAFDHRAEGTVFGSGAGVVVLRRLTDAIADSDHIWAVIKGSAINNDGAAKAGYLAPSVDGQAAAIAEAQAMANITADTIDYVECHGTGTYLGDPIEVAALTEAFEETTDETQFCKIGSVKTNIGHLDTAAGAAGLIKTALSLHHREIPPSLGYEKPNPAIDFESGPFSVNDTLSPWVSHNGPRRAGVNSLGVGGTNAHLVLEEAPKRAASEESDWPFQILTVSGRSKAALEANAANLASYLRTNPDQPLADIAWTLKERRRGFERRRVVVAETHADAAKLLEENDPRRVFSHTVVGEDPDYVFMFPGGGAQYAGMARDLYETEPVFAEWMDRGLDVLQPKLDYDIRALWLPELDAIEAANTTLKKPSVQLPLIMITEYALAQLWMSWGVEPSALVGHSMGENTAACVAGVMSFEDCIGLVHLRGQLFDTVPAGGMLSIVLSADELEPLLGDDLDLGAVNAPNLSVATGPQAELDALEARLVQRSIDFQRIPIDIAAHSRMLEPILKKFGDYLRSIPLNPPKIPFTSNRTGDYITDAQAQDPDYWVAHLRGTVHFSDCLTTLADAPARVFIEVGPGKALSSLAGQHGKVTANQVISSLRHPDDDTPDDAYFLAMLGRIWAVGGQFDWDQFWGEARRLHIPLPTYAFQQSSYFIEPGRPALDSDAQWLSRTDDVEEWSYRPAWTPRYAECDIDVKGDLSEATKQTWLIFEDDAGLGADVAAKLRSADHKVVTVKPGDTFARVGEMGYIIAPERGRESYDALIHDLNTRDLVPTRIVHAWTITKDESFRPGSSFFHRVQEQGFYSLLFLAQAIGGEDLPMPIHLTVLSSGAMQRANEELPYPEKATVAGPVRVIPREFSGMTVSQLDIEPLRQGRLRRGPDKTDQSRIVDQILEEVLAAPTCGTALIRNDKRYALGYQTTNLPDLDSELPVLKDGGVYLLTGGFGGIGLTLAHELIERCNAKIALLARSPLPPRDTWDQALQNNAPGTAIVRRIEAIRELEAMGGEVLTLVADVSNVEDMRLAKSTLEEHFGKVDGIIHAAGQIDDDPIMAKTVTSIEDVFAPKIHGTQVLHEVFPDGSLDWMVLFSSSSTATAPIGQVDYVAANEYLNAYAKSRSGGQTRVLAINWGIWADVGMAADAMDSRLGKATPPPVTPINAPMLDEATFDTVGNRCFRAEYRVSERWFLDDHRTMAGDALVPGTGYLELATEALRAQGETSAFEIRDLYFLRPLTVSDHAPRDIRVGLLRTDLGYDLSVESGELGQFEQNAQASLSLLPISTPAPLDIAAIEARCSNKVDAGDAGWMASPQEVHLKFGPRWRVLQSTTLGDGEGLATLALPDAAAGDAKAGYHLHPALMDIATGWAMNLIAGYEAAHLWVPVSYRSVKVFGPLPSNIVSWVRNSADNRADSETASFDITIAAPDGTICVEIHDFSIRRMDTDAGFAITPPSTASATPADGGMRPLSPAEERLRHNLTQGIRADEGAALFLRALSSPQRQVIVSSLNLDALIEQAGQVDDGAQGRGQKFERPELDSEFIKPEGPIEERLAAFWQDLLGVDEIGVEDSFFDLGGHSLIAVRLFAQIRKAWQVDFPISVLFEAPTIRKCAALIAAQGVNNETDADSEDIAQAAPERRFTHLVPMHTGESSTKSPFFLVAGMFGNVLNLRHLAHLVGNDRPFYGLQARGLFGSEEPHRTITEAARDYIAEMRQVQPEGPYMVGGFSGGGITAYEIAHQLTAAGEIVSAVVMLDTPLPVRPSISRADKLRIKWMDLRKGGVSYIVNWAKDRIAWEIQKRRGNDDTAEEGQQFHNVAIQDAFLESVGSYEIAPWSGPLTLFRPPLVPTWIIGDKLVSEYRTYLYSDNDWTKFAPKVEVFEVPGDHDSMVLEPNVRVLAARIKQVLEDASRDSHTSTKAAPTKQAAE